MHNDQTKTNNPDIEPQPTSRIDLSNHPDAIEAGIGSSTGTKPTNNTGNSPSIDLSSPDLSGGKNQKVSSNPNKKHLNPVQWFKALSKRKKIALIVAAFILLTGGTVSAMLLSRQKPAPSPPAAIVEPPKPTTEASKLTGVQVKPDLNKRSITAVMIENSLDARPQSGLADAGVVFEAIAEGGITRFLTLFQETQPANIGPVRSVRPYYVDWLQAFDASVAHVGGSGEALAKIKNERVKDLDQFFNPVPYRRESTRFAPHNMYTSTAALDKLKKEKGFTSTNFDGFVRKDKEEPSQTPKAKIIDFNISGFNFNPHYEYVAKTNTYARSLAGKPHTDLNTKKQIRAKVVIAIVMDYGIASNGVNSRYNSIGKGKAFIFQDGNVQTGTWAKTSGKQQISFKNDKGEPIKLNPGNTWISAVGSATGVTYK